MANYVDVLLCAYSSKPLLSGKWFETMWASAVGTPVPIILEIPQPAAGASGMVSSGNYGSYVKKIQDANGGSFLKPFLTSNLLKNTVNVLKIPSGCTVGRIGIIGFSAGGGAISQILASDVDRALLDFVYYCDGMHASWDSSKVTTTPPFGPPPFTYSNPLVTQFDNRVDGTLVQDLILESSLAGQRAFAGSAAKGDTCMVVTHSQVVPDGPTFPSTTEAATKVISMVQQDIGDFKPQGAIYPAALFEEAGSEANWPQGDKSDDQGTYWEESYPAWQGCGHKAMFRAPYPITRTSAMGNFIVLGVGVKDTSPASGCSRAVASSGPSHEFQADVIQKEVMRLVLTERWRTECTHGALQGLSGKVLGMRAASLVSPQRKPSGTIVKRNPRRLVPVSMRGLGDDGGLACIMEGVFSNLFSVDDIAAAQMLAKAKIIGGAALAGLALKLLWDRYVR